MKWGWLTDWLKSLLPKWMRPEQKEPKRTLPENAVPWSRIKCFGSADPSTWAETQPLHKVYDTGRLVVYDTPAHEVFPTLEGVSASAWAGQLQPDGFYYCHPHEYMRSGNDKRGIPWQEMYDGNPGWPTYDRRKDTVHFVSGLARDSRRNIEERTNNVLRRGSG